MAANMWLVFFGIVALAFALGYVASLLKRPRLDLAIDLSIPAVSPVGSRDEWNVRFDAAFFNRGRSAVSVGSIQVFAAKHGAESLVAKRILGEPVGTRHHGHTHPPDIALGLPILVEPGRKKAYVFECFFTVGLRRYWDEGDVRFVATTLDGLVVEVQASLMAPS